MGDAEEPRLTGISPFFAVADIEATLKFYCESLRFELGWKFGDPPTHANVCRDEIDISFAVDPKTVGTGNIYIYTSDVNAVHAELVGRGVKAGSLEDRAYGMRDFLVLDPDGNRLVFGQSIA